jgi:adenosylhomocysteine nucleosidase
VLRRSTPRVTSAIGVVTGMRVEAAIARRCTHLVASTGGRPLAADSQASKLIERGATALLSLGIAGGLAPELPTGAVVVATSVVVRSGTIAADAEWCARLARGIPGAISGTVLGSDRVIGRAHQKAELFQRTRALAVDLESGGVARVAASAGIPFAVIRAIADPASCDLPPAALVGLGQRGGVDLVAVFGSLRREPRQLSKLLAAARDARAALAALRRGIHELGRELGLELEAL